MAPPPEGQSIRQGLLQQLGRRASEGGIVFEHVDDDAGVDDPAHRRFSLARISFIQAAVRLGVRKVLANPNIAVGPGIFCPDSTTRRTSREESFCHRKRLPGLRPSSLRKDAGKDAWPRSVRVVTSALMMRRL
jgi:hypothetical protein